MKRSLNNKTILGILLGFICSISLTAQDTLKNDFGLFVSVYTGPVFFPATYHQFSPSFTLGAGIGLSLFTTELEIGGNYAPVFFEKTYTGTQYQKVNYTAHNVKFTLYAHQKLFQVKKHILSLRAGLELIYNYGLNTDTLMNDGTHRQNRYVPNHYLNKTMGLNIYGGVRYSYHVKKKWLLLAEPYFTAKVISEYLGDWYGGHLPDTPDFYDGNGDRFSIGVKLGFVYLVSKNIPRFYVKMPRKKK